MDERKNKTKFQICHRINKLYQSKISLTDIEYCFCHAAEYHYLWVSILAADCEAVVS